MDTSSQLHPHRHLPLIIPAWCMQGSGFAPTCAKLAKSVLLVKLVNSVKIVSLVGQAKLMSQVEKFLDFKS